MLIHSTTRDKITVTVLLLTVTVLLFLFRLVLISEISSPLFFRIISYESRETSKRLWRNGVFVDWTTYINPEYKNLFKLLSNIKEQSITKINSGLKTIQRKNKGEEISEITTKENENRRTVNLYRQSVKWLRRKYKFQMFVV